MHGNFITITVYADFVISKRNRNSTLVITQWKIALKKAVETAIVAFAPAFPSRSAIIRLNVANARFVYQPFTRDQRARGNYATQPRHAGIN